MSNILSIVDKTPEGYTPQDALNQAQIAINTDKKTAFGNCNKMVIIAINDSLELYQINYISANLKYSEIIAAVEYLKDFIFKETS